MASASCYFLSPSSPGLTYIAANRMFNFRVEQHGDHVHCDLSIHLIQADILLGGGRYLPRMHFRDFGACRFRFSLSEGEYNPADLMDLIESEQFQEFALGPLDDLAGSVNPERFDMLAD